ncbi:YppG family protein [Salipaludibacillus sp. CF4.18]|uniref:YppG family protein n=1 Tax=Salipaludibacillus sp. CF4.18 TaxID=3373081 RepID=UPI003EE50BF7
MFFPKQSYPPYHQHNFYRPHPYHQMNNAPPAYQQPPPQFYQAGPSGRWGYNAQIGNYSGYPPQPQQVSKTAKLMKAFQTAEGKFDYQKAWTTMDQVVKTANQVSPIVKQVGSFFTRP